METGEGKSMEDEGKRENDANLRREDPPPTSLEMEEGPQSKLPHDHTEVPLRPVGPDLLLDERLSSAAAPFLYLLSIILIAVAGYFAYMFFHG